MATNIFFAVALLLDAIIGSQEKRLKEKSTSSWIVFLIYTLMSALSRRSSYSSIYADIYLGRYERIARTRARLYISDYGSRIPSGKKFSVHNAQLEGREITSVSLQAEVRHHVSYL